MVINGRCVGEFVRLKMHYSCGFGATVFKFPHDLPIHGASKIKTGLMFPLKCDANQNKGHVAHVQLTQCKQTAVTFQKCQQTIVRNAL